jgi:hypothetical protein
MNMFRYPAGAVINGQALAEPAVLAPCRVVIGDVLHGPEICELWAPEALAALGIKRVVADPLPVDGTGWPYLPGAPVDVEEPEFIRRTYPNAQPDLEGSAANLAAQREAERARLQAELTAIDAASARPLRAVLTATTSGGEVDPADLARLSDLEAQARALRAELAELEA